MRGSLARWLARGGLLAASALLGLLVAEGAVRVLAPQPLPAYAPGIWIPDDTGLGHRLAADVDEVVNTGERDVRFRTDALGHRIGDSGPSDRDADLRILAVGDSFLEAMAVDWDHTVTGRLESWFGEHAGVDTVVVNAGVSGTTPNHYRMFAERELVERPADAVLVFVFVGNDVISHRRDDLPKRPPQGREALRWPTSLTPRELASAWLHPLYTQLRERSHLVVLLKSRGLGVLARLGLTDQAFPSVFVPSEATAGRWVVTADLCAEIASNAARSNAPTLVVLLPPDYAIDRDMGLAFAASAGLGADDVDFGQPARILGQLLEARGVASLDVAPALERVWADGTTPLYGRVDRHLSPEGHRVVAEAVADRLATLLGEWERGDRVGPQT